MARFDIYRNDGSHSLSTPYLIDVQSNVLEPLNTRVVIPARRLDHFAQVTLPKDLTPVFIIEGVKCMLDTSKLAAIPKHELKTRVGAIDGQLVVAALDRLFGSY
ncbi:toxin CcdB [Oxalobacteraceae bacterium GrIS 2.11]